MKNELVFVLEPDAGRVTVEISRIPKTVTNSLENDLGNGSSINCGKPTHDEPAEAKGEASRFLHSERIPEDNFSIWLYRLYHNSTVDGPGRRSVIQVAGCSIRCPGCYVPQTHERHNGTLVPISSVVAEIIANRSAHDGVTILGGEPFDQPGPVAELVSRLKRLGIHITVYSGNTIETLSGRNDANIQYILTHVDLLIDGPFISGHSKNAGEYSGSGNQRFLVAAYAARGSAHGRDGDYKVADERC